MKKIIGVAILVLSMILGCNTKSENRYSTSAPEIDQIASLISTYEAGDWTAWEGHYADTAKVYHNSLEAVSPEELMQGFKESLEPMKSYKFQENDQFKEMVIDDRGRKWVNFWGNWEGVIAENEKKIVIPVHITAQFVDGKIVEEHAYYNMEPMMLAMMELEKSRDSITAE